MTISSEFAVGDTVTWKPDRRADFVEKFGDGPFEIVNIQKQHHRPHAHKKGGSGKPLLTLCSSDGTTHQIGEIHLTRALKK